ncbi:MAG: 2-amino-4-hydroxy-6-hydroxymethyldihydropteridine diphosphokinase [Ignavibacteriaceae bacterium]|nr:2-amino-4-hydroxy-6-hydroxymethyldihydropteridine diphosphokinase [Ignavibacteriaceae bacterium]
MGLGSNKGNKLEYLRRAVIKLNETPGSHVIRSSSVYETKPFGYKDQENFLNAAIEVSTESPLLEVIDCLKRIEKELGRVPSERWGPREIDLDLLFYNDVVFSNEKVTVPHKEVASRDFVLVPLCEIIPGFIHPALNLKICDICISDTEKYIVKKLSDTIL